MPDRLTGAEDADRDRDRVDPSVGEVGSDPEGAAHIGDGAETSTDPEGAGHIENDAESDESRQARIEAAKRRYRATLRNEADTGGGGFSEDYYRSQKPPHWS
ncbi:hypothetical protein [Brevibacterium limosum]|uniref:hypothetical protein n=1 Tax=Brevibacterium limosum TaxID=2697565 RepID=UPI00142373D1|nr:hypothetical protein [Brevibacterium limosum]